MKLNILTNVFKASMRGAEGPMGLTGPPGPEGELGTEGPKGEQGDQGEPVSIINWKINIIIFSKMTLKKGMLFYV